MIYPVYSWRDNKVCFGAPQVDQNDQSAIRGFSFAINSREGIMNFSPSDYDLYRIGYFDSEKGCLIPENPIVMVSSGGSIYEK